MSENSSTTEKTTLSDILKKRMIKKVIFVRKIMRIPYSTFVAKQKENALPLDACQRAAEYFGMSVDQIDFTE